MTLFEYSVMYFNVNCYAFCRADRPARISITAPFPSGTVLPRIMPHIFRKVRQKAAVMFFQYSSRSRQFEVFLLLYDLRHDPPLFSFKIFAGTVETHPFRL